MGHQPRKEKKSWVAPRVKTWRREEYPKWVQKFYNSKLWRMTSKKNLTKNPYCVRCAEKEIVTKADVTDHVIPVMQGGHLLHSDNHESLCHPCHNAKSAKERTGVIEQWVEIDGKKFSKRMIEKKNFNKT